MGNFLKKMAIAAVSTSVSISAFAQALSPVGAAVDWSVFQDPSNSKHCYVVSAPKSSKAMIDGQNVDVNRGDIRMYVGIKNGATEPSFAAGYPLNSTKAVEVKIGETPFNFFTSSNANAEFAWPRQSSDSAIIAAMRAGVSMTVTGLSQRGTTTVDTFSLSGFTAAYNKAREVCGN